MEAKSFPALRRVPVVVWILLTAVAPIAWGSNYFVTREFLPQDNVLWGSVYRALPAGLMLLAVSRRLPTGGWWWKSVILGAVNVGAFFVLVYAAAQLLPASVASTVMAMSAATLMILAWPIVKEKPAVLPLAGALVGFLGVGFMVFDQGSDINFLGIACSLFAMLLSSIGALLTKKWAVHQRPLDLTAWQLTAGGLMLIPVAALFEGPPSALDHSGFWASVYVCVVATAIAFFVWFQGLKHLSAATVGLIGLLNPVTGVLTGTLLAAETFGVQQLVGVVLVLLGVVFGFGGPSGRSSSRRALKAPRGLSKTSGVDCQM